MNLKALNRFPEATTINFVQLKLTLTALHKKDILLLFFSLHMLLLLQTEGTSFPEFCA